MSVHKYIHFYMLYVCTKIHTHMCILGTIKEQIKGSLLRKDVFPKFWSKF